MPLLQVPTVRFLTGLRRDEIFDRVDGRSLLHRDFVWVWDLSTTFPANETRDLRFWREEVIEAEINGRGVNKLKLAEVIGEILPANRRHFHSGELIQMFALSRPALQKLRDELNGDLRGARNCLFTRANVAAFLERRWEPRAAKARDEAKQHKEPLAV